VILVHGYGSNGEDLIQLAGMWRPHFPDLAWVSPDAPEPCPGAPGGYQWWGLMGGGDRTAGIRTAAPVLDAFIDEELERHGLSEDRLVLIGFSQGTMMSLFVAPRRERQLAGVIGYSGRLIDPDSLPREMRSKPPILLVHGDADPMVPVASTTQAQETLVGLGFPVAMHISPGVGHSIDQQGLTLGGQFLATVLR
jgi:phospholipase/carboxylesterase